MNVNTMTVALYCMNVNILSVLILTILHSGFVGRTTDSVIPLFFVPLTWAGNHLSLHQHPEMSRDEVEETLLILQENQRDFLPELVDAVPRWMFSGPDLFREV